MCEGTIKLFCLVHTILEISGLSAVYENQIVSFSIVLSRFFNDWDKTKMTNSSYEKTAYATIITQHCMIVGWTRECYKFPIIVHAGAVHVHVTCALKIYFGQFFQPHDLFRPGDCSHIFNDTGNLEQSNLNLKSMTEQFFILFLDQSNKFLKAL